MKTQLVATLASLTIASATVISTGPAQAAGDARENLTLAIEATAAANAAGYSYRLVIVDTSPYTISAIGADLGTSAPQLDATWYTDDLGVFTATFRGARGDARTYRSYREWKNYWAGDATKKVREAVRDAVAAENGSDASLMVDTKFTADAWQDEQGLYVFEPSTDVRAALNLLPGDAPVTEETSATGAVFSFKVTGGTMRVETDTNGLIDSYTFTQANGVVGTTVTMLARGSAVQRPDLSPLILDTNILLQANKYSRDRADLRLSVRSIKETAVALAKAAGSRVTAKILTRAVNTAPIESSMKVTRTASGYTLSAKDSRSYADFGKVCATISPGKSQPRVVYCH